MKKLVQVTMVIISLFTFNAAANDFSKYDDLSLHIEEVVEKDGNTGIIGDDDPDASGSDFTTVIDNANGIIAIGKELWAIIQDGRPVVDFAGAPSINVLPGTKEPDVSFYQMSNWSMPKMRNYRIVFKNGFGSEVVDFKFSVSFQHSGKFEGKGDYISGLTIIPKSVNVSWGYTVNAVTSLVNISNLRSLENPLASATMQLKYEVSTVFKKTIETVSVFVDGQGRVKLIE